MDSKDDINIKYEPLDTLDYDADGFNSASGKTASVTGFHPTLASEKFIKTEVEEHEEEKKIDIKYESLDYGLKRSAIENENEHAEEQLECHKCCYKSKYKHSLKRHIMTIHEKEKMPRHACQLCSFKTVHVHHLNRHVMYKHAENTEQFECPNCSYKSNYKHNLEKHVLSIHKNASHIMRNHTEFSLECALCQKSFKHKKSLDSHYVSIHQDQSDSFKHLLTSKVNQCLKCSYITGDASAFKRHLLTHEDDQIKFKFECYTCGYKCVQKSNLIKHIRLHTDQLPFACSECNQRFNQKTQLDSHIVYRHKENEELMKTVTSKIHQCLRCSFRTVRSFDLKKHTKYCNNE